MDIHHIQQRLVNALQERNRLFPLRDQHNDREVNDALTEFARAVNLLQTEQSIPDDDLVAGALAALDEPVFLCGPMKSGTTLLLELLDGHSELIVLPGDSFFWGRLKNDNPPSPDQLQAECDRWLKRMVNPTGQEPFWIFGTDIQPYVKFVRFFYYWYGQFPDEWRSIALSALSSYYCANPARPSTPGLWIEKTPGNENKVELLAENFPNARFVHIVRDPRENMASLKKLFATRQWSWEPYGTADMLAGSCRAAMENQQRLGRERYHILSYEALTEHTEKIMKNLAGFLGIRWEDDLLRPSVNGRPAHANSMYSDRQVTGMVRKSAGDRWRSVLTRREQRAALATLPDASIMGYEWRAGLTHSAMLRIDKGMSKLRHFFRSDR